MRIALAILVLAACEREITPIPPIRPVGRWSMQLGLEYFGGLSAEMVEDQHVDGVAWLDLGSDGTARGCFGIHTRDHWIDSWRSSPDHKTHSSGSDRRELFALRGRWTSSATSVELAMEVEITGSCQPWSAGPDRAPPPQQLHLSCTPEPPFARVGTPNATLTCIDRGAYPNGIGLGLGVALKDAMPLPTWHGGPVLIFGRAPGVHVEVGLDVGSVSQPRITLGRAILREADFAPTKNTEYRD